MMYSSLFCLKTLGAQDRPGSVPARFDMKKKKLKNKTSKEAVISQILHYRIHEEEQTNISAFFLRRDSVFIGDREIHTRRITPSHGHVSSPGSF
jgi:hypothetical protein